MKAFVTGATGFVGSHVARLLAEQGADLRLLVRAGSRRENLAGLHADLVVGDLTDPASLRKGMEGCEAVFHRGCRLSPVDSRSASDVCGQRGWHRRRDRGGTGGRGAPDRLLLLGGHAGIWL